MAEATRRTTVPLNESYTSLGGDSLGYLNVQIFLNRTLGSAPPGWENMTLRQLQDMAPNQDKAPTAWVGLDAGDERTPRRCGSAPQCGT